MFSFKSPYDIVKQQFMKYDNEFNNKILKKLSKIIYNKQMDSETKLEAMKNLWEQNPYVDLNQHVNSKDLTIEQPTIPLEEAIDAGDIEVVRYLFNKGAKLRIGSEDSSHVQELLRCKVFLMAAWQI